MYVSRLLVSGVGPFRKLDVSFADERGNVLGPHVIAGVNGAGKSTVLRCLAWMVGWLNGGLNEAEMQQFEALTAGHDRFLVVLQVTENTNEAGAKWSFISGKTEGFSSTKNVQQWMADEFGQEVSESIWAGVQNVSLWGTIPSSMDGLTLTPEMGFVDEGKIASLSRNGEPTPKRPILAAAYGPSTVLDSGAILQPVAPPPEIARSALRFSRTVDNQQLQNWLLSMFVNRALATQRQESTSKFDEGLRLIAVCLAEIFGDPSVSIDVEYDPRYQIRVRFQNELLNFSQLPDGVKNVLGIVADFWMRSTAHPDPQARTTQQPGILLIDEIDAHLHPKWQRAILPALAKTFPHTQIIATSHSPFVISSCEQAQIHTLCRGEDGAYAEPAVKAPVGQSIYATLQDIFDVDSRFASPAIERDLNRLNDLRRERERGTLDDQKDLELKNLTISLSSKGEELRHLVGQPNGLRSKLRDLLANKPDGEIASDGMVGDA